MAKNDEAQKSAFEVKGVTLRHNGVRHAAGSQLLLTEEEARGLSEYICVPIEPVTSPDAEPVTPSLTEGASGKNPIIDKEKVK